MAPSVINMSNLTYEQYASQFFVVYLYSDILVYTFRSAGVVAAAGNVLVLANKTILASSETFYFIFIMSIADFLYIGGMLWSDVLNQACGRSSTLCSLDVQYLALFIQKGIDDYFTAGTMIFNVLIEIFLNVQRLFILKNKPFIHPKLKVRHVILVSFTIAAPLYVPVLFENVIEKHHVELTNNTIIEEYSLVNTAFGNSLIGRLTPMILSCIRLTLCGPVLLTASIANMVSFRRYLSKKTTVSRKSVGNQSAHRSSSKSRMSIVVFTTALLYTFGNLPYMVYYSLSQAMPSIRSTSFMIALRWFSLLCLTSLIILKLPVYLTFNRHFRNRFLTLFCCVKSESLKQAEATMRSTYTIPSNRALKS